MPFVQPRFVDTFSGTEFGEVEDFPHSFHSMILPLVLIKENYFKPIGTAFVVNQKAAYLVTAKHNIEEAYGLLDLGNHDVDTLALGHLHVFYASKIKNGPESYTGGLVAVRQMYLSPFSDVAVLCTKVPVETGGTPDQSLFSSFQLSPGIPKEGTKCIGFGYNEMDWQPVSSKEKMVNMALSLKSTPGVIEEIHVPKRDNLLINYPSFRTNARFDGGMSGGPIFHENGQVCGIITKSYDRTCDNLENISYGALSACLLPLEIWSDPESEQKGKNYLYQLIQENKIACDQTFQDFCFETVPEGILVKSKNEPFMLIT